MANRNNLLSQSIFSDLKRAGANDEQILEMLGVKQLPPKSQPQSQPQPQPPSNVNNNNNNSNNVNNNKGAANNNNNIVIENVKKSDQSLKSSKEEIENRERELANEILAAVSTGNKENFLSNDDVDILKRDSYSLPFSSLPNGLCSFLGRKNNRNFDEYQLNVPHPRVRLFNHNNARNNNNNEGGGGKEKGEEMVISSLIIKSSSVSFLRKTLPYIPPPPSSSSLREECKLTLADNSLSLLSSPSFCPLLFDWKRNDVIGEAMDIHHSIFSSDSSNGAPYVYSSVADEDGKNIYMSTVSKANGVGADGGGAGVREGGVVEGNLNFIEWPVDQSMKLRLFHLYSYDISSLDHLNDGVDDHHLSSFYSPSRRERVRVAMGAIRHEIKISESWIVLFTYPSLPSNQPANALTLYFIDRSSIPKRSDGEINLDHLLNHPPPSPQSSSSSSSYNAAYEMEAIEVTAFKLILPNLLGKINEISVAYDDGKGSNLCVSLIPAGSSFNRYDRIERSDKLRSTNAHGGSSSSSSSSSIFQSMGGMMGLGSFIGGNHANAHAAFSHKPDEVLIGLPTCDQNADQKANPVRLLYLDPRNPPSLILSRDTSFDFHPKGALEQINKRAKSKEGFVYLSIGSWPELDIHRTIDPSNLLLPPPSRQFPSLFSADQKYLFEKPTFISAATFIPSSADPFAFSDEGFILLAVVTEEEGRLVEEFQIFDSKEFANGAAFVIRPKSPLELSFNFGVNNYSGVWGDLKSFLV